MLASWCEAVGDRDALSSRPRSLGGLLYDSAGPRQKVVARLEGQSMREDADQLNFAQGKLEQQQLSAREKGHVSKEHAA